MAAANNEFFEALSMLEHERGITAEYLIEKIKAAIVIAVKKNYEVEDDNVLVEIDPDSGKFNVALAIPTSTIPVNSFVRISICPPKITSSTIFCVIFGYNISNAMAVTMLATANT